MGPEFSCRLMALTNAIKGVILQPGRQQPPHSLPATHLAALSIPPGRARR
jgi:hypothetical protein